MNLALPDGNARDYVLVTTRFKRVGKQLKHAYELCAKTNVGAKNYSRQKERLAMSIRGPGHQRHSFAEASLHCTTCPKALAGAT